MKNIWATSFGDKYTDRNKPNIAERAKFFRRIIPKDVKSIHEFGCSSGHNLRAVNVYGNYLVSGHDINPKAIKIAQSQCLYVKSIPQLADLILTAGYLIHQNPIDILNHFRFLDNCSNKYVLMIEHKENSVRTINQKHYKNSFWVMDFGKEFCKRFPYKILKQGWVNGEKPKEIDYVSALPEGQGFLNSDYFWLLVKNG